MVDEPADDHRPTGRRRTLWLAWIVVWPITLALLLFPIRTGATRVLVLAGLVFLWAGALLLVWRRRWAAVAVGSLGGIIFLGLVLPGGAVDAEALRQRYLERLRAAEGTAYVWGGESWLGLDCSGLVRAGMVDASVIEGLRTLNPGLFRAALHLWWHDTTARRLGEGDTQLTGRLFDAASINDVVASTLRPGDLAVTADGVHVLAFLGDNKWIAADPDSRRVQVETVPSTNRWFGVPVTLVRWRQLEV